MKNTRARISIIIITALAILACGFFFLWWGNQERERSRYSRELDQASACEWDGLRGSIKDMKWQGDDLQIDYCLIRLEDPAQRVGRGRIWIRWREKVSVHFWDDEENELGLEWVAIYPDDAIDRGQKDLIKGWPMQVKCNSEVFVFAVKVPERSVRVSVRFRELFSTKPIELPARK